MGELRDRENVNEVEKQLDREHLRRLAGAGPQKPRWCF
jgi:hypothetical protein